MSSCILFVESCISQPHLPHLFNGGPENTEHQPLHPVGKQPGLQAPPQEPHHALLPQNHLGGVFLPYWLVVSLSDRLHHPHRVGDGVRDHAGSEPDARTSQQALPPLVKLRQHLLQEAYLIFVTGATGIPV